MGAIRELNVEVARKAGFLPAGGAGGGGRAQTSRVSVRGRPHPALPDPRSDSGQRRDAGWRGPR